MEGKTVETVTHSIAIAQRPQVKALATRATSIQPRFQPGRRDELVNRVYMGIIALAREADEAPKRGDPRRDVYLRDLVRSAVEPILTGAISSMVSRFVALGWSVTGGRNKAIRARSILANAEDAKGWHIFVSKLVEDMLVVDKGGFMELATLGKHGPVRGLFNLDATCCELTGDSRYPVVYTPKVGRNNKQRPLDRDHVVHLPTMPSPDEAEFNLSLCLHGDAAVLLADGYKRIAKVVQEQHPGPIMTLDNQGHLVFRKITGWHKTPINGRKLFNIRGVNVQHCRGAKQRNSWVTEDHPVLTPQGWQKADELRVGDEIVTGYPFPNRLQRELLIGTLLGDSGAQRAYKNTRFAMGHKQSSKEWLELKLSALSQFGWVVYKNNSAYKQMGLDGYLLCATGKYLPSLNMFRERFYPHGKKVIPVELVAEHLSPLLLTAWYLDDGTIMYRDPGPGNNSPYALICTQGFVLDDIKTICQHLTARGYICHPQKVGEKHNIYFTVKGSKKFFEDIAPYVPGCMRYKLPRGASAFVPSLWELGPAEPFIDKIIVKGPADRVRGSSVQSVYDITVEGTHNFVTAGIVVHNSAVSRALRAAQILKAINDHDTEKLRRLPPEGIMTVANITESQWKDVLSNYREARKKDSMTVFPGVMVIAGQSITQPPLITLTPFSTLPEGFNKLETVEIYVKTLALALGVDVAELWLIPQVGATKAAFTIQHMKARGKGIGLIVSMLERALNFSVMPEGVVFGFDVPDDEQDMAKAEIEGRRIQNVTGLYETKRPDAVGLISRQEGRQILATQGILSPAFAEAEEVTLFDVAKAKMRGMGPFFRGGGEEIVTLDRYGRIFGVALPTSWREKAKGEPEAADVGLREASKQADMPELGQPLPTDEALGGWEITDEDRRRIEADFDKTLDFFEREGG